MKIRHWEYPSVGKAVAESLEPIAVYTVTEVPRGGRRKHPTFRAAILSEMGWIGFDPEFRTVKSAQRFCQHDVDQWRAQIS
jgi:hypothetical protein